MRLLVIGGTQFVGRHLVAAALAAGHEVTLFHRGRTNPGLFPQAEHRLGDRNEDLSALRDGAWDATMDVSAYVPRQVRLLADSLGLHGSRGGRYLQVSSVSAYAEPEDPAAVPAAGMPEWSPLATPADPDAEEVTGETYGGLKALCEAEALECFGTSSVIVRPTYVVGPWDHTGRFTSWVRRLSRGGRVVVPGPADQPVQVIDARALAAFMLHLVEDAVTGVFNAAGPPPPYTLADLFEDVAGALAPAGTELVWVAPDALDAAGAGPRQLPLWAGGERSPLGAVDPSAAMAEGLRPRPVAETALDVLDAEDTPLVPGVGLDPETETALLRGA